MFVSAKVENDVDASDLEPSTTVRLTLRSTEGSAFKGFAIVSNRPKESFFVDIDTSQVRSAPSSDDALYYWTTRH